MNPAADAPRRVVSVNLMPPALRLRAQMNSARLQAGAVLLGVVVITGALLGWTLVDRVAAEGQLKAAEQRLGAVDALKKQYGDVPGVYAAMAQARTELSTAMSQEVQFSAVLTNLGILVPDNVAVSSATLTVGAAASGSKTGKSAGAASESTDLGTAIFTGEAAGMPEVAKLLDAFTAAEEYTAVHLDSATVASDEGGSRVQYTISAKFTDKALSGRFTGSDKPGSPPASPSASPPASPSAGGQP